MGIYNILGAALSFRWIAIFSTASDCSGPIDWTGTRTDWRIIISPTAQVITGTIIAKIDDCAVFIDKPKLSDGSQLPSFITYDVYSHQLKVNVDANHTPSTILVKACAYLNDKVTTAKSECKDIAIVIYN